MEMNELRYFLAVAKTENINRASENINISAGSLSKAISRLEDELGIKLFNRVGRGIILSKEGEFLKEKAIQILNLETETKLNILGQETSFKAYIGGNETLLSYFGINLTQKITSLYENVQVELQEYKGAQLLTKLNDGEINLALTTEKPSKEFSSICISNVKFHTVVGPSHPLYNQAKKNKIIHIDDILKHDFIIPKSSILGKTSASQSVDGWRDDKFLRKKPFITTSLKTLENFVTQGVALAYIPDYMILNSKMETLNISHCPYSCEQKIYLAAKNKKDLSWVHQVFQSYL